MILVGFLGFKSGDEVGYGFFEAVFPEEAVGVEEFADAVGLFHGEAVGLVEVDLDVVVGLVPRERRRNLREVRPRQKKITYPDADGVWYFGLGHEDGVLLDEFDGELQYAAKDEVPRAADSKERSRLRKGHGVELRRHGEEAGDDHEADLQVVDVVVLLVAAAL